MDEHLDGFTIYINNFIPAINDRASGNHLCPLFSGSPAAQTKGLHHSYLEGCKLLFLKKENAMKTIKSNQSAEQTVETLLRAIEQQNMRVVAHINGQANAAKLGKTVAADQILEVFRPDYAIRVWEACKEAGHDIPLRIHVYEQDEEVIVACRMPGEVFMPFNSRELDAIGVELDEIFGHIINSVNEG
jgi:uncharacterized protein (DUF302 family)